ncbi:MAG: hydrogenase, partial [Candidatus Levybacteria bacterium CG10_big_fil_rev_8_21_14_0_10_36_30]
MSLYSKILSVPLTLVPRKIINQQNDVTIVQKGIEKKIKKLFGGSLAIREVDTGSTNACEQELMALTNTYYDIERFGIH